MKIYTKTGDKGTTSLFGGRRVPKHDIRIDTYGTVDELNAYVGMIRHQDIDKTDKDRLITIQTNLFTIGSELATDPGKAKLRSGKERLKISKIGEGDVETLEKSIDKMNADLPPLKHFILPGGHDVVSYCHLSRVVCRRTERLATALYEEEPFDENLLKYLNRLSDYFFVLSRKLGQRFNAEEIKWTPAK